MSKMMIYQWTSYRTEVCLAAPTANGSRRAVIDGWHKIIIGTQIAESLHNETERNLKSTSEKQC